MSKLKGDNLKFIARHLEKMDKSRAGRGIYFCFDTVKNGEFAYGILDGLYPGFDHSCGLDKRDFNILFYSRSDRDSEYDALSEDIRNYTIAHDDEIAAAFGETEDVGSYVGTEGEESKGGTYIVVGAAAAIVILLLLWKK